MDNTQEKLKDYERFIDVEKASPEAYTVEGKKALTLPGLSLHVAFDQTTKAAVRLEGWMDSRVGPRSFTLEGPQLDRVVAALWDDALLDITLACRLLVMGRGWVLSWSPEGEEAPEEKDLRVARKIILPFFRESRT